MPGSQPTGTITWYKSSLSVGNDACVEVGFAADGTVVVRDSKQQGHGPVLKFNPAEWDAFIGGVQLGEFERSVT